MTATIRRRAPTGFGVSLGVVGGILLAWGLLGGEKQLLIAGSMALGVLLSAYALARLSAARLVAGLRRSVYGEAVEGSRLVVRLELDNSKGLIPVLATMRDSPPTGGRPGGVILAPPGGRGYVDYEVIARSGKRRFGTVEAYLRDPLGLYELKIDLDPEDRFLTASPRPLAPARAVEIAVEEAPARAMLKRGPGIEFHSVREYVEGDDFRLIEWKATARLQRLMVKELRVEASTPLILLMAPGPSGDEGPAGTTFFEKAARILAGMALEATRLGSPAGYIGVAGGDIVRQPPRPGAGGAEAVLQGLAATPPSGGLPATLSFIVREYLQAHVRGPALLLAAAGPGVEDEVRAAVVEAIEGTRVKAGLLKVGVDGGVEVEWVAGPG